LSIFSHLRLIYLCRFSKPHSDRAIYREIRRRKMRKIVELGIGGGRRAQRMIEAAKLVSPAEEVHYVGIDLFEGRPEPTGPILSLKGAHRLLSGTAARVQLVPGNPSDALTRIANSLGKVDLLIVPAELDSASHSRFWFFVPRMLDERSLVMVERTGENEQTVLTPKPRAEIDALAAPGKKRRAA
jgi:hypothetical protein